MPPSEAQLLAQLYSRPASSAPAGPPPAQPSRPPARTEGQLLGGLYDANSNPNMSTAEDWFRSGVTGPEKGFTGNLGLPRAVSDAGDWITDRGIDAAEALTGRHLTPQRREQLHMLTRPMQTGLTLGVARHDAPSTADIDQGLQHVAGPYHTPQSAGGRYIERAGEFAGGAAFPGGIWARTARVVLPAALSQGAEDLAPAPYKPAAALAGGLVGGGVEGGVEGIAAAPEIQMAKALRGMTAAQARQVVALRDATSAMGLDLTVPEAVQQVTGGATDAAHLQRVIESARRTRGEMETYMAKRPGQVSGVVNAYVDHLLKDAPPQPGMLATRSQEAAQGALDTTRQGINAAAQPYYDALRGEEMGPTFSGALRGNPSYEQALGTIRGNPELNAGIAGLPDSNLAVVNDVVKQLDASAIGAKQTAMNPGGNNYLSSLREQARQRADLLASVLSDNWRNARGIVQQGRKAYLDPLEQGPTGAIAASDNLGSQTGALYPPQPYRGQPDATAMTVQALKGQDPDVPSWLTGQHMAQTFDSTGGAANQAGVSQWGGAAYAKALMGNPTQADTLRAGLDAIDDSGGLTDRLNAMVEGLRATGQRMRPGSLTAFNAEDMNALKTAPAAARFLKGVGDPLEWGKNISDLSGGVMYRRNLDTISRLLRDPDTAAVLSRVLGARGQPGIAQYLLPAASQGQQP